MTQGSPDVAPTQAGLMDQRQPAEGKSTAPAPLGRTLALLGVTIGLSTVLTGSIAGPKRDRFPARLLATKEVIVAPSDGTIDEIKVKSGQIVTNNQELLVISKPRQQELLTAADQEIERLEMELCSAQAKAAVESQRLIDELDQQIFKLEDQIAVMGGDCYLERMRAKAWSENTTYFNALSSTEIPLSGLHPISKSLQTPRDQIDSILQEAESENRAETLKARIELCQNRLKIIRDRKDQIVKQFESAVGVSGIEKRLTLAKAQRAELESKADNQTITATGYGLAGLVAHVPNDKVKTGDVLVEVYDRDKEFVEADIPAHLAGTLKPGDTLQVHFPDNTVREGQVETIPPQTTRSNKAESEITVKVLPTGRVWPYLPIGSTVQVSVR